MKCKEEHQRLIFLDDSQQPLGEIAWTPIENNILRVDHTYVEPRYRGKRLAEQLVFQVVEKARRENKKIIPECPFAKKEFETNQTYQDVLKK